MAIHESGEGFIVGGFLTTGDKGKNETFTRREEGYMSVTELGRLAPNPGEGNDVPVPEQKKGVGKSIIWVIVISTPIAYGLYLWFQAGMPFFS